MGHCIVLKHTEGSIGNHEHVYESYHANCSYMLFMATTSEQGTIGTIAPTAPTAANHSPSGQPRLQEMIKKEIIEARNETRDAINGMTSLLAGLLSPIVKIIQTDAIFKERIERERERDHEEDTYRGTHQKYEDLWKAKSDMMDEVLMEEGKKYADMMKILATAVEGPEFWRNPIEGFFKVLMSHMNNDKGESEKVREGAEREDKENENERKD